MKADELNRQGSDTIVSYNGQQLNKADLVNIMSSDYFLGRIHMTKDDLPPEIIGAHLGSFVFRTISEEDYTVLMSELRQQTISKLQELIKGF